MHQNCLTFWSPVASSFPPYAVDLLSHAKIGALCIVFSRFSVKTKHGSIQPLKKRIFVIVNIIQGIFIVVHLDS